MNPLSEPSSTSAKPGGKPAAVIRAIRPPQWSKNLLVFVPMFMAHAWADADRWRAAVLTFVLWSLVASLGYVVNDLLDVRSDRLHPRKASRPFASGALSVGAGVGIGAALLVGALALTLVLPLTVGLLAGVYLATTLAYSTYLKRKMIVDVLVLAGLYTLRLLAGGAAADVALSPWLLAFSMFLFLSLALVKRYAELREVVQMQATVNARRGYQADDLPVLLGVGPASGYIAVLIAALYLNSRTVTELYAHPMVLWGVCPLLLYWITRMWLLAHRGRMDDDPLTFAGRDRVTYIVAVLAVATVIAATRQWSWAG